MGWRLFTKFLEEFDTEPELLDEHEWVDYTRMFSAHLFTLGEEKKWASATINKYLAGVKAGAKDLSDGKIDLGKDFVLSQMWQGTQRTMQCKPNKAVAWSISEIRQLLPKGKSLIDVRDRALLLTGIFGLLRGQELVELKWEDLTWEENFVSVSIKQSKTDQLGLGAEVILPVINKDICPVKALRKLRSRVIQEGHIFRSWNHRKKNWNQRAMSRNAVSARLQTLAKNASLPTKDVSSHTLRRSGATAIANVGISDTMLKLIGRWKSRASQGYVDPQREALAKALSMIGEGVTVV